MIWKSLFEYTILNRGKNYYNNNKVEILDRSNIGYMCTVKGNRLYNVFIGVEDDMVTEMSCTCPHAKAGNNCKHMAAALYTIEEEQNRNKKESDESYIKKFPKDEEIQGEYLYFDADAILKEMRIFRSTFKAAVSLAKADKVQLKDVFYGYRSLRDFPILIAEGIVKTGRLEHNVRVTFSKDTLIDTLCDCPSCMRFGIRYYWNRDEELGCRHIGALFILAIKHAIENNLGDDTDCIGTKILKAYKSNMLETVSRPDASGQLELVPKLEKKNGKLSLGFKIGYDKKFVVKNLSNLVNNIDNDRTETYGKNTEINHNIENFGASRRYIDFIKKCVKDEEYIENRIALKYNLNQASKEVGSGFTIFGNRADELYDLIGNDEFEYTNKDGASSKKLSLTCGENNPELYLDIRPNINGKTGDFDGVNVYCEMEDIIEGSSDAYYICEKSKKFNKVDKNFASKIMPLVKVAEEGIVSFNVGRNHLSDLFYDFLPRVKDSVSVTYMDEEIIRKYLRPQGEYAFYIDSLEGDATCKATVSYGDDTLSLLDENKAFYREFDKEEKVLALLANWFSETDKDKQILKCTEEDKIYNLLESGLAKLMEIGQVFTTENFGKLKVRRKTNVTVGVAVSNGLLDLQITSDDISKDELVNILESYRLKKKYYRLKNGDFLDMNDSSIDAMNEMIDRLGVSAKELEEGAVKIPMYRALYLDKMLEDNEDIYSNRDMHFRSLIKDFKTISESDFVEPLSLTRILRNYQKKGFKWLKTIEAYNFGGILADDMGLGKTLQTIAILLSAKENNGENEPSLIICPAALVYNWGEELSKFAKELKVCLVTGTVEERKNLIKDYKKYDVLVTSYDLAKRDIAYYKKANFNYEVIDEAQYIKNHKTAAAKSVKVIKSKHKLALTGTPIENRLSELWSIFDYLMPGFLYSYEDFKKTFEIPIVKENQEEKTAQLQKMVSPFIMRRLKKDVLKELPDKIEKVRFDRFEGEQQKLYDAQVLRMKDLVSSQDEGTFNKSKILILAELTRLRQICCDPSLCFEDYAGNSAKREGCIELVESAIEGGHKILLFSQFTSMLDLLEEDLKKAGISYYMITGATPKEKRLELVNEFNVDDTKVFLISLKAGGTGLNLTGADVVIHYDPWWNLAVQNQATDRAHRIGQTKVVTEYKLIAKNTIEEKIQELQNKKKDLADQIINGDGSSLSAMSKEDLLELLNA